MRTAPGKRLCSLAEDTTELRECVISANSVLPSFPTFRISHLLYLRDCHIPHRQDMGVDTWGYHSLEQDSLGLTALPAMVRCTVMCSSQI